MIVLASHLLGIMDKRLSNDSAAATLGGTHGPL